jgi:LPS export ABC transporter protein LptC
MPYRRILLATWLLAGCQQGSTTPSATANADSLPAETVLFGVHHVTTKDGVRSSVLDGDTAYQHEGTGTLYITGVRLKFFTEGGAESGELTSRKGEYDPSGGLFVARDNVVLLTRDANGPRRIETEELNYQVKTDELWTEQPFVMTQGERVTRGTRFKTDGKFSNWNVSNAETTGGLPAEESGFSF